MSTENANNGGDNRRRLRPDIANAVVSIRNRNANRDGGGSGANGGLGSGTIGENVGSLGNSRNADAGDSDVIDANRVNELANFNADRVVNGSGDRDNDGGGSGDGHGGNGRGHGGNNIRNDSSAERERFTTADSEVVSSSILLDDPDIIDASKIFSGEERLTDKKTGGKVGRPAKTVEIRALKGLFFFVYGFVGSIFGDRDFWELSESEATDLATEFLRVLEAFPSKTSKAFLRALEKYMPLFAFCAVMYATTLPRWKHSMKKVEAKKKAANDENVFAGGQNSADSYDGRITI